MVVGRGFWVGVGVGVLVKGGMNLREGEGGAETAEMVV